MYLQAGRSALLVLVLFLVTAPASSKVLLGFGGDGGSKHEMDCGANSVLVGLNARYGNFMDAIAAVCKRVQGDGRLGADYEVGLFGGNGGMPHRKTCPASSVVVGMFGTYGRYINSVTLICAEWNSQSKAPERRERARIEFSGTQPGPDHGDVVSCEPGTFASGMYVSSGVFVDHVNLVCDPYQAN